MSYNYSFEKLEVWKLAVNLAENIYRLTAAFPEAEKYGLISQLRRAAVSVSSNLAEGSARVSPKEQAHFSQLAYSSLMELISQLYLSNRLGFLSEEEHETLRPALLELSNKINRYRKSQLGRLQETPGGYGNQNWEEMEDDLTLDELNPSYQPPPQTNRSTDKLLEADGYFYHSTAIIDAGARIGKNTRIWHFSHVMGKAVIGENCSLGQNVFVANGVELGNGVKVQNNVSLYEGVICEDEVFLGPSLVLTNVINPRSGVERKNEYKPTIIGKGATLGANATIVCGHQIGRYSFVGAGATVTKAVPPYALVVGNPARQTGWMSEQGYKLKFDENGRAVCPGNGAVYLLRDGQVSKLD